MYNLLDIANEFYSYLGARFFEEITGSKNFVFNVEEFSLTFKISSEAQRNTKANSIRIISTSNGFTVQLVKIVKFPFANFLKLRTKKWVIVYKSLEQLYIDELQDICLFWIRELKKGNLFFNKMHKIERR